MIQKTVLYIAVAAVAALCLIVLYKGHRLPFASESPSTNVLKQDLRYEIVNTPEAREKGLSGRTHLDTDYGMLFVFDTKDTYGFWMRDMLIPIDIIWLSDNGTILGIEDSVEPDTYPSVFYSPEPVKYVLEIAAGNARAHEWHTGSVIPIPLQD